jgi:hypothetical protein
LDADLRIGHRLETGRRSESYIYIYVQITISLSSFKISAKPFIKFITNKYLKSIISSSVHPDNSIKFQWYWLKKTS